MKPGQQTSTNATGGLLANEDVQKLMKVVEGLLNGSKKLVIESVATPKYTTTKDSTGVEEALRTTFSVNYKHTFKVEDVK